MSNSIIVGRVAEVKGLVMAENPEGGSRILTAGQPIYQSDIIYTGQDSHVTILDAEKGFHNLGQCVRLDIAGQAESDPSLAMIQTSLKKGSDLSVVLAPTAAGPDSAVNQQQSAQTQDNPAQNGAQGQTQAQATDPENIDEFLEGLPATAAGPAAAGGGGAAGGDGGRELVWIDHLLPQGAVNGTYPTVGIFRETLGQLDDVAVLPAGDPIALDGAITHDETAGVDDDADDVLDIPDDVDMIISDVFENDTPESCGFAQAQLVFAFGDDTGGKLILDPVTDGVDSGLTATIDGSSESILLFNEGDNVIVGRADGEAIFLIYLDSPSGTVYLAQFEQINHPDTMDFDEQVSIDFLTYTIMDNDGDMSSAQLIVNFQDDGPSIGEPDMVMVDEGGLDGSSDGIGNVMAMGSVDVDFGKDGPGRLEFNPQTVSSLPALTANGDEVEYSLTDNNTVLLAQADGDDVFRIEFELVNGLPTGKVILNLYQPIDHLGENDLEVAFNLDFIAFDVDGDSVESSFLAKIKDDTPLAKDDRDMVEEGKGNQTMGNVITGVDPDMPVENMLQMDMLSIDQPHKLMSITHDGTTYMLSDDMQSVTSDGNQEYEFNANNGKLKFTTEMGGQFIIDLFGNNAGKYTYKAPTSLFHEECDVAIEEQFEYGLKDFDGDISTAVLTIAVKDGEPVAGRMVMDVVKEAGLKGGSTAQLDSEIAMGMIPGFNPGPDKANLTIDIELKTIADTNAVDMEGSNPFPNDLTSMGQDISYSNPSSGLFIATREDGAEVFRLRIQKDGTYTFKLKEQLDHPEAGQYNENDIFDLTFQYTLDDHDGCEPDDSARGMIVITIEDDKPKARDTNAGMLRENHDSDPIMDTVSGTLKFSSGADDPAKVVDLFARPAKDTDDGNKIQPLTSGGYTIDFAKTETAQSIWLKGTITVDNDVLDVVTVKVDKMSGDYDINLIRPLDHPDQGESGADDQITLRFGYTVEDFDGDQATSWLKVSVKDDAPQAKDDWDMVKEGGMTRGNVITGYDPDGPHARKFLQEDWVGADKPGMIMNLQHDGVLYTLNVDDNTVHANDDVDFHYDQNTSTLTIHTALDGTLSIKLQGPDAGWYKYTAADSVHHDKCDDDGNPVPEFEVFRYGLKDFDGDIDYAILDIAVKDGEPKAGRPVVGTVEEKALNPEGTMPGSDNEMVMGVIDGFDAGPDGDNLWITFDLVNIADTNSIDQEGNNPYQGDLQSQGIDLIYSSPSNGVFEAHRDGGDDALVFRLTLNNEGKYTFELFEQLDHPEMNQAFENDIFDLKFQYTLDDHDGCPPDDSAKGMITITIEDDVPKAKDTRAPMLSEQHDVEGVMDSVTGTLNFKSGADDPAKVIALSARVAKDADDGDPIDPLTSGGHEVTFTEHQNANSIWLKGTIEVDGQTINVMTLHVDKMSGDYRIDLHQQLDHPDQGESGADDQITVRFKYTVQDFDGDKSSSWLNVNVKDDAPHAKDDWDMVKEGSMTFGNVVTGYDPDGPHARKYLQADWVGADKPGMIMNLHHDGVLYTLNADDNTVHANDDVNFHYDQHTNMLTIHTALDGTLSIKLQGPDAGWYKYTAADSVQHGDCDDDGNPVPEFEVFRYGLKDFDGDIDYAILDIAVKDGEPKAGRPVVGTVEEKALNPEGTMPGSDNEMVMGVIDGFDAGPDGDNLWITFDLVNIADTNAVDQEGSNPYLGDLQSQGYDLIYTSPSNGVFEAHRDGGDDALVFRLTLNSEGKYTFELFEQLDHPEMNQAFEKDIFDLKFQYTLDDHDGCPPEDSAKGMITITVEDDVPKAKDTRAPMLSEQHDVEGVMDSVTGTLNFKSGADDPAKVISLSARTAKDADDGDPIDPLTSGGHEVSFTEHQNANSIWLKGTIEVDGQTINVMTVHVDKMSGDYRIDLHQQLDHPDQGESGADDQITVRFKYTVQDFDGDKSSSWLNVNVKDDAPHAKDDWDMVKEGGMTRGNVITGYDPDGPHARKFLQEDWVGADKPGMIMNLQHDGVLYTLNVDDNTVHANDDVDFHYDQNTSTLTIHTALDGTLSIKLQGPDAGWYKYTASDSVHNDKCDDDGNPVPEFEVFRYGLKDFDGDIDYAILDIAVKDGEPKAGRPVVGTVEEKALNPEGTMPGSDNEMVMGVIDGFDAGPDGDNLWITFDLVNIADTNAVDHEGNNPYQSDLQSQGIDLIYSSPSNGVFEAHRDGGDDALVFRLTLNNEGKYTFELFEQLDHPEMNQAFENDIFDLKFQYTLDDHDGCPPEDSAKGMITITVEDDVPKAKDTRAPMLSEQHDVEGVMDSVTGKLNFKSGADDPAKVIALSARVAKDADDGDPIDPLTSGGHEVTFTEHQNANSIWLKGTIEVDGQTINVMTVHVDKMSGDYRIDLHQQLDHPDQGESGADDQITVRFKYTVQDFDGDKSSSWLNVNVKDDAPHAKDDWDMVKEGGMTFGNVVTGYDPDGPHARKYLQADWVGADKPGMIMNLLHDGVLYTLNAEDNTVHANDDVNFHYNQNTSTLTIHTALDGTLSIKLQGPDAGWYKYTAADSVQHGDCDDDGNPVPEFEVFRYGLKDFDGDIDYAILDIAVKDGEPKAGRPVVGTVEEKALNLEGTMPESDNEMVMGIIDGFDAGPDGDNLWITFDLVNIADTNAVDQEGNNPYQGTLQSQGVDLVFSQPSNGVFEAHRDGGDEALVFRLTLNNEGKYTFELFEQLDHPEMNQAFENDIFDLKFQYTLDDHDGCLPEDSAKGMITITVEDDMPIARDTNAGMIWESDIENHQASVHGTLHFKSGADDPAKIIDLFILPALDVDDGGQINPLTSCGHEVEFSQHEDQNSIWLKGTIVQYGQTVEVLTIHVDKHTGDYTIKQHTAIDHPDVNETGVDDQIKVRVGYTVQDFDGDKKTSWLNVNIKDDGPEIEDVCVMVRDQEIPLPPIEDMRLHPQDGLYQIDGNCKITVDAEFINEFAGFSNSFGYYFADGSGNPISGEIIWASSDADDNADFSRMFVPDELPAGTKALGFFLIPDGAGNNDIHDGDSVVFNLIDGQWTAVHDGEAFEGTDAPAYFSDPSLNPDGKDHEIDNELPGNSNWEDLFMLGDVDHNDMNINLAVSKLPLACAYAEGEVPVDYGADQKLSLLLTGDVWVEDQQPLLVNGETVNLSTNMSGTTVHGTVDGQVVFILSLDPQQETFQFWQFQPFDDAHPDDDIETLQLGFDVQASDKDFDTVLGKIIIKTKLEIDKPPSGADIMAKAECFYEDNAATPLAQVTADEGCAIVEIKVTLIDPNHDVISKVFLSGVPAMVDVEGWIFNAQDNVWEYDNLAQPLFESGEFSQVKLNLPEHWDKDLNLTVSTEVKNVQSEQTIVVVDTDPVHVLIDAVAAQPDVLEVVATDVSGDGYIQAGEKVNLAINVQFHDIQDNGIDGEGAERQFVCFKVPDGWSLVNGDNLMIDQYVGFEAESMGDGWYQVDVTDYLDEHHINDGQTITVKPMVMAPEELEGSKTYVFHADHPSHNSAGGEIKEVWTSYNPDSEKLTFSLKITDETEGFTLALNDGPNPKGNAGELALIYFDKDGGPDGQPVVSVYEYNGENNPNSYLNPGNLIASSLINPELFMITVNDLAHGKQELSFMLDGSVVSDFFENPGNNPDPEWTGISFDDQIGIWLHPFGEDLSTDYNHDGELTQWSGTQGWYDINYHETECTCEGIQFEAVAKSFDPASDEDKTLLNNEASDDESSNELCITVLPTPIIDIEKFIEVSEMSDDYLCQTLGKASVLTFTYTGLDDSVMNHGQDTRKTFAVGDPELDSEVFIVVKSKQGLVYFEGIVNLNEDFIVDAANAGRESFNAEVKVEIYDEFNGELLQLARYHTSCSQPIQLGDAVGAIKLVAYENHEGEIAASTIQRYDADAAPGIEIDPNQDISFIYEVTNPGETPLSHVVVKDDNGTPEDQSDDFMPEYIGGDTNENNLIDNGEIWSYRAQHNTIEGQYSNTAEVTAKDENNQVAEDQDSANYFNITKTMHYQHGHDCHGSDEENDFNVLIINNSAIDIDFTTISDTSVSNIERIDMRNNSDVDNSNTLTLNLNDVISMTDGANVLQIMGDSADTVNLINGDGAWNPIGDTLIGSVTFAQFEQGGATVQIQQEVNVDLS